MTLPDSQQYPLKTFKGFRCDLGIAICSWRVTESYAYSPFNQQIFPLNNSIGPSYFLNSLEIELVLRKKENRHIAHYLELI